MVKVDEDLVPLHDELAHVSAYIEIQAIRYAGRFTSSVETDGMADDMLVPPLIVQTFVENAMKYAIRLTENVHIAVSVASFEIDFEPYARINIRDNGAGYPAELLPVLNSGGALPANGGRRLGIRNVQRRLQIIFGKSASCKFENDNGAVSCITLPVRFANEDDEEVGK
jgi:two-component system sensor histidine kinase YesM